MYKIYLQYDNIEKQYRLFFDNPDIIIKYGCCCIYTFYSNKYDYKKILSNFKNRKAIFQDIDFNVNDYIIVVDKEYQKCGVII